VIPCDHRVKGEEDSYSHVIYSDDRGKSWKVGGRSVAKTNECAVVERDDGSLLLNMRSHHGKNRRALATSTDRGETWSEIAFDEALIEPTCQASLIRLEERGKSLFVFSNPASTKRERMTVRLSADQGKTWLAARVLYAKSAAYSSLVALPGGQIGCLYERDGYKEIVFARFGLGWLVDGRD
jgi:sialidase-1